MSQGVHMHWQASPAFSEFLQGDLLRRLKANPRYSLRAYAKTLGVDPSVLSKILKGKRRVSRGVFQKVSERLSLTPDQRKSFAASLGLGQATPENQESPYETLSSDHFYIISEWYHYGIFSLLRLKNFKATPKSVAKALGITLLEAGLALSRLERVGMAQKKTDGSWKRVEKSVTNHQSGTTNAPRRQYQKQILQKALSALDEISIERRDQSSMTMAIDTRLLPAAREAITTFRRALSDLLQKTNDFDDIYQLSISLFPLTLQPPRRIR